jgi:hypothetical protein
LVHFSITLCTIWNQLSSSVHLAEIVHQRSCSATTWQNHLVHVLVEMRIEGHAASRWAIVGLSHLLHALVEVCAKSDVCVLLGKGTFSMLWSECSARSSSAGRWAKSSSSLALVALIVEGKLCNGRKSHQQAVKGS